MEAIASLETAVLCCINVVGCRRQGHVCSSVADYFCSFAVNAKRHCILRKIEVYLLELVEFEVWDGFYCDYTLNLFI